MGFKGASVLAVVLVVAAIAIFAPGISAQYAEGYQINVVQQQIRTRIVNDLRGSNHDFEFRNDTRVNSTNIRNQNRVSGSGSHRFSRAGWRLFSYEALFNLTNASVTNVTYAFYDGPIGGVDPPGGGVDMYWEGRVDDVVRIRVSGRSAFANAISGRPVSGVTYDFLNPLPRRNLIVNVSKTEGRGSVRIVEQPNIRNNYTAVLEIRDPRGGADNYAFELDWRGGGGGFDPPNRPPNRPPIGDSRSMSWSGRVDDVIEIRISGRYATTQTISGSRPTNIRYNFERALPRREVSVSVDRSDGRGTVRVVEQPSRRNNYTAVIEIRDPRSGADNYSFELEWDRFDDDDYDARNVFSWRGNVDGTVRISIRRNSVTTRVLSGQSILRDFYNFSESLPFRAVNVSVDKREGRGSVTVVQQPALGNAYTAVVEIRDPRGGRDDYEFDLIW
ncbi:MAG: hypothetical protein DWQ47_06945 [Acidobacteria bacterium]|nr:MAG: hypothetical protein DWQ32_15045 [Acidobacteriota bacterium]REJ99337.1 MAG: hypothetical protein DWQ38_14930 [Acidobacteriota bacterium]REK15641.1 MAG: hypothetical protein DWQ43_05580 [Acidobacteriota bacterium]REK43624.1 MAG: hypothetical protein DWQ47_06945 [Acidobacteriota bacterium]